MSTAASPSVFRAGFVGLAGVLILGVAVLGIRSVSEFLCAGALAAEDFQKLRFVLLMVALSLLAASMISDGRHDSLRSRLAIFLAPFLSLVLVALYKSRFGLDEPVYLAVSREDNIVEYATFASLAGASVFAAMASRLAWRAGMRAVAIILGLLAAFTLFVALEEISYGQRIFGFETPEELEAMNRQQEFNIHNVGQWAWLTDELLPDLVIAYCLFGWLLLELLRRAAPRLVARLPGADLIVMPWHVASFMIPIATFRIFTSSGYDVETCCRRGQLIIWQDQEPAEMLFGLAFLLFAWGGYRSVRGRSNRLEMHDPHEPGLPVNQPS